MDAEKLELLCTVGGSAIWCSPYGKQYAVAQKTKVELSYDLATLLMSIHSKELKTGTRTGYLHVHVHSSIIHNSQR